MARFSQFVRSRLALQQREVTDHPDPNLLDAFAEGRLPASERAGILAHLAQCPDCREVVALISRSRESELSRVPARESRGFAWWVWRASAAAAVICLVTTVIWRSPLFEDIPQPQRPAPPVIASEPPVIKSEPPAVPVVVIPQSKKKLLILPKSVSRPKSAQITQPTADVQVPVDQTATVPNTMFHSRFQASAAKTFLLRAPLARANNLWSLGASAEGTVQKSEDGGRTWQAIHVDDHARLYALSATGSNIWVGGAAGTLFHSTDDGVHWIPIAVTSDDTPLTGTIIGIEALDDQQVRLKTKSGEEWVTTDGGLHWRRE